MIKDDRLISDKLIRELGAIGLECRATPIAQLMQHSQILERLRDWCRSALWECHLVKVAHKLWGELRASIEDMVIMGIPVDILEQFPNWRNASREGFGPVNSGLRPVPNGAGHPLGLIRIQLSPASGTIPYSLMLLRDMLRRMDPSVGFVVVVEPGANLEGLREMAGEFHPNAVDRVRFVPMRCITVFAQDNARTARDTDGKPVLMFPRAFRRKGHRAEDELSLKDVEEGFGIKGFHSRMYWEGGNVIQNEDRCFIGVDSIAENMVRLGLAEEEVVENLSAEFGCEIVPMGDLSAVKYKNSELEMSGQASFHIDLDISILGRFGRKRRPRVLIADPARGIDLMPSVLSHRELFSNHFVPPDRAKELIEAEYYACAEERHPKLLVYNDTLKEYGYTVIGVPDLRVDPAENLFRTVNLDFNYCNVLPGLWNDQPAIHYLPWGIRSLDMDAEKRFCAAGVKPVKISSNYHIANALMMLYGGFHCFCGQMMD